MGIGMRFGCVNDDWLICEYTVGTDKDYGGSPELQWKLSVQACDPRHLCWAVGTQSAMAFIRSAILIVAKLEKVSETA
jgi:hypothetical protein